MYKRQVQKLDKFLTSGVKEIAKVSITDSGIYALAFSPDGKQIVSADGENQLKIWDSSTGEELATRLAHSAAVSSVAFSPDGKTLIAGGADHRIRVWAISDSAAEGTNTLRHSRFAHEGIILHLAWSPNGNTLLSTPSKQTAKLWDAQAIITLRSLQTLTDWPTAALLTDTLAYITQRNGQLKHFRVK